MALVYRCSFAAPGYSRNAGSVHVRKSLDVPRHDVANAAELAVKFAVDLGMRIPEGEVLRVERALGDDGLVADQRPVQAVGGLEGVQSVFRSAAASGQRLVACLRRAGGIGVFERREIVASQPVPHDVVGFRAGELAQAQLGLRPMDAVTAFGIADDFGVRGFAGLRVVVRSPVVHPVPIAVLKDRVVGARVAFPRLVRHQHDFLRRGFLQHLPRIAAQLADQVVVDEQFPLRTDVDRLRRASG